MAIPQVYHARKSPLQTLQAAVMGILQFFKQSLGSASDPTMSRPTASRKRQSKESHDQEGQPTVSGMNPDKSRLKLQNVAPERLAHDMRPTPKPRHGVTKHKGDKYATQDHQHIGKVTTDISRKTEDKTKALPDLGRRTDDHRSSASRSQKSTKDALKARIAKERELKLLTDDLAGTVELYHDMRLSFACKLLSGQSLLVKPWLSNGICGFGDWIDQFSSYAGMAKFRGRSL